MKKVIFILLTVVFSSVATIAVDLSKEMKNQNRDIIKLVVKEVSKKLPQKVDNYTKLIAISSKDLRLIYTFEIFSGAKSDETIVKEGKDRMQKIIPQGICNSSKRFLLSNIDITYIYISAVSKKTLFKFDITKGDCKY